MGFCEECRTTKEESALTKCKRCNMWVCDDCIEDHDCDGWEDNENLWGEPEEEEG